jgi:hypothetical protein
MYESRAQCSILSSLSSDFVFSSLHLYVCGYSAMVSMVTISIIPAFPVLSDLRSGFPVPNCLGLIRSMLDLLLTPPNERLHTELWLCPQLQRTLSAHVPKMWSEVLYGWCDAIVEPLERQRPNWAPYHIAVRLPNVLIMQRAPYSSALTWLVDGRWRWEVLYKLKLTSLTISFTSMNDLTSQRPYHRKCSMAIVDVGLTMQHLLLQQRMGQ